MMIIVQPAKGSDKLLFFDGRHIRGAGIVELHRDPKRGPPGKIPAEMGVKKRLQHTPSKDLINQLREGDVRMVKPDPLFEAFLHDFQVKTGKVDACRMCLLDERYTPLTDDNYVIFGKNEKICLDCGRRELRREIAHSGRIGKDTLRHFETLLADTRNLDRVLALIQPGKTVNVVGAV